MLYGERGGVLKFGGVIAGCAALAVVADGIFRVSTAEAAPLRPPGYQGESDFLSLCIKCGKCMESCPYLALRPAPAQYGAAVGTPILNVREQACRLCEDFPCVNACPTHALRDVEQRSDVNMGKAVIDEDLCISFKGMRCEVCYRACPLIDTAITIDFRHREGDGIHAIFAPQISDEDCVGCGLCVERCVVSDPTVAIRIEPA